MNLYISPRVKGVDQGDGGIRRVIEAQYKHLPQYGFKLLDSAENADVVAVHATALVKTQAPIVAHCHGLYWAEYEWPRWAIHANLEVKTVMQRAAVVTSPSKWVSYALARGFLIDATTLYHGIEPEEWPAGNNDGYVLWNKTRVDPVCDPAAVDRLASRFAGTTFVSTAPSAAPNVRSTGKLPYLEGQQLVRNAGVYLCTSRETFGIGTLEAMASGVPILGWNFGGQAEFVRHKIDGWLARPFDYDDLAEGLEFCLANRDMLGKNARELATTEFTWERRISDYVDVYVRATQRPELKVSVVMPSYNLSEFLPAAIESVLKQDYDSFELIVVDDCSPDDSYAIAQAYATKDPRVRVLRTPQNMYVAGALNTGIAAARGEYFMALDADNELAPHSLRLLADSLDHRPDLSIVYGKMSVMVPNGEPWISEWPVERPLLSEQLSHRNQISSTNLARISEVRRVGGYRRRCRTGEDPDLWCRMMSFGAKAERTVDGVTLVYRNRHDSVSHTNAEWPWEAWYPWGSDEHLTPPGAVDDASLPVPSYGPSMITAVVPVGPGHGRYLNDALDSLIAQTYTNWKVVIVNDSGEPLEWVPPFVTLIETPGGKGPAFARNRGLEHVTTPLWVALDADDYLQPNALQLMLEAYLQYGGYVYSDWIVQETGEVHRTEDPNAETLLRLLPHAVTCLYETAMWKEVGGFDESLQAWEDWDFILALAAAGFCGTRVPAPLFQYRMGSGSRREALYAQRETAKAAMLSKWSKYMNREVQLMACGGCGQGGGRTAVPRTAAAVTAPSGDMVLLEYIDPNHPGAITFKGQETGQLYRFSSTVEGRTKYVHAADAQYFLSRQDFKRAEGVAGRVLEAAGPPTR